MALRTPIAYAVPWLLARGMRHASVPSRRLACARANPAPIAIASPATHSTGSANRRAEQPADVCAIDPEACPSLETDRAQRIVVGQVTSAASEESEVVSGPLAGAAAVRSSGYGYQADETANAPSSTPPAAIPVKPA